MKTRVEGHCCLRYLGSRSIKFENIYFIEHYYKLLKKNTNTIEKGYCRLDQRAEVETKQPSF